MTNIEKYQASFCKTAAAAGVDPYELIKIAKANNWFDTTVDRFKKLSPEVKKSLLGGLLASVGTFTFADGDFDQRLLKSVLTGGTTGLGLYGLQRSGLYDKAKNWVTDKVNKV